MPQQHWTYQRSPHDKPHPVSIYHGDKSRHVVLYSQNIIIKIDFNVSTDRMYGFMIDDELFELSLTWKSGVPYYILTHVDSATLVASDPNIKRSHMFKALIFTAIILVFAIALGYFIGK